MAASFPWTKPPARRNDDKTGHFCVVGWAKMENTMDDESQTPGMIAPLLFFLVRSLFGHAIWVHVYHGWHGFADLRRGGNPKSYASSRWWLVGAALLYLACLFSLSSLLFYDHVFYSLRVMFCMLCTPALVTLLSWWLFLFFPFFFCIYCILLWRLARRHGWELRTISRDGRSVGRWECIERDVGGTGLGGFLVYIHCIVQ